MPERTPIGGAHARDFDDYRQQRTLAELTADAEGFVRFGCLDLKCRRTGKVRLDALRRRFGPGEGLVNILNTLAPKGCPKATPDPWGNRQCGFCYRGLI